MYEFLLKQIRYLSPGAGLLTSTVWVGFFLCPSLCVRVWVLQISILHWLGGTGRAGLHCYATPLDQNRGHQFWDTPIYYPCFLETFKQSLILWMLDAHEDDANDTQNDTLTKVCTRCRHCKTDRGPPYFRMSLRSLQWEPLVPLQVDRWRRSQVLCKRMSLEECGT